MKLGIAGLPLAGKTTLFAALTGARGDNAGGSPQKDTRIATTTVLDERIDFLENMYQPRKTIYAKIEYLLPSRIPGLPTGNPMGNSGIRFEPATAYCTWFAISRALEPALQRARPIFARSKMR